MEMCKSILFFLLVFIIPQSIKTSSIAANVDSYVNALTASSYFDPATSKTNESIEKNIFFAKNLSSNLRSC